MEGGIVWCFLVGRFQVFGSWIVLALWVLGVAVAQ
jgi:hypothetical protein